MSTPGPWSLKTLLEQTQAALSLMESGTMFAMTEQEKHYLLKKYGPFDFIIGDFLIKRIHGEGANTPLAPGNDGNEKIILLLDISIGHLQSALRGGINLIRGDVFDHIVSLKAAIKELEHGANTPLACGSEEAHNLGVSERREHENDHLIHALHDMRVELIRTTEGLRSLSIVLPKTDLYNTEKVNMKISELAGGLNEVKTSALKAFSEVRNRIDAADARIVILEKSLADADLPPEAEAAFAELKTIHKQLDDIVPDAPELPPVVTPPTPA